MHLTCAMIKTSESRFKQIQTTIWDVWAVSRPCVLHTIEVFTSATLPYSNPCCRCDDDNGDLLWLAVQGLTALYSIVDLFWLQCRCTVHNHTDTHTHKANGVVLRHGPFWSTDIARNSLTLLHVSCPSRQGRWNFELIFRWKFETF